MAVLQDRGGAGEETADPGPNLERKRGGACPNPAARV